MHRVERELKKQDWDAQVHTDEENDRLWLEVIKEEHVDFVYEIRGKEHGLPDYAFPEIPRGDATDTDYYRAEAFLRRGGQSYDNIGFDQKDIMTDILDQLEKQPNFRELP